MTSPPLPVLASLLAKAAADNGFDREVPSEGPWLRYASTLCPLRIWLGTQDGIVLLIAVSQANVSGALGDQAQPMALPVPPGAAAGFVVTDLSALDQLLRRAFQLSRTLPDALLRAFEKATAALPRATEAEQMIVRRVGQGVFRQGLLDFWEGRCAVTGLAVPELLRASHIKPWADCATDDERLDVYNGVLLAPNLDAAFDCGFLTIAGDGVLVVAQSLDQEARRVLGLAGSLRASGLVAQHHAYLAWHRARVFRGVS